MITRLCAAIVALLVFAAMILAGMAVGNPFATIIKRALMGLCGGLVVGYIAGYVSERIVNEHFMRIVDADADSELVEPAGQADESAESADLAGSPEVAHATSGEGEDQDKGDGRNGREEGNASKGATLSVRAATETLSGR